MGNIELAVPVGMSDEAHAHAALSLIIPAFNEASRISDTLKEAHEYLTSQSEPFEIIVVDDGSSDSTAAIVDAFTATHPAVRLVKIAHGGKAAAVRAGVDAARMNLVAFSDADLAVSLTHLSEFREAVGRGCAVVIGSREGVGARRLGEPAYRHLMGRVFNAMVRLLVLPGIHDTQCGFKLFTSEAGHRIFERSRLYSLPPRGVTGPRVTAFDVEVLVLARRLGYKICVIPVVWTYGQHSKVNPIRDTLYNTLDVLKVRLNDWRGKYS